MKAVTKKLLSCCGLDVRLVRNVRHHESVTWEQKQDAMWRPFLMHRNIRTIIDVGANTGQFARMIHRQCPDAGIVSFEPLDSCRVELESLLNGIPGSRLIKAAVGETPGVAKMNSSDFSPCSSLLQATELLGEDYADAAEVRTIEVPVVRIDDALKDESLADDILVKFDVQGFEIPAMRGAEELLSKASIVVCEVCFFRRLYQGQPLFDDIYGELRDRGFRYMGNAEQSLRKTDGRVVEADAIFERIE
jgi:FkbM family methyltransferase